MVWVLVAIGAAIGVVLLIAASRSSVFRVERSATVEAPLERVYELVSDFHRWTEWSPWEGLDPAMKRTHEGSERGVGAVYAWEGNKKAGAGRMEIKEAAPPERLTIALDFLKPFKASYTTAFTFTPSDAGTTVTWTMTGAASFGLRVMGVFVSMERMVGRDFERGLASLATAATSRTPSQPASDPGTSEPGTGV